MLNKHHLAVVIPALNEASTIKKVVDSIIARGAVPIVVDDGSTDNTVKLAESAGAVVVSHETNRGYETALSTGVHEAAAQGYEFAATFDADGQLNPDDLPRFVSLLESGNYDIVIGVRDYRNRYSEYMLSLLGRIRFGLRDPLCGLKLYRINAAKKYFPFDTKKLVGMELAFKMIDAGCRVYETPIHVKRRIGESRYGSSFRGEINIIKSFIQVLKIFGIKRIKKLS